MRIQKHIPRNPCSHPCNLFCTALHPRHPGRPKKHVSFSKMQQINIILQGLYEVTYNSIFLLVLVIFVFFIILVVLSLRILLLFVVLVVLCLRILLLFVILVVLCLRILLLFIILFFVILLQYNIFGPTKVSLDVCSHGKQYQIDEMSKSNNTHLGQAPPSFFLQELLSFLQDTKNLLPIGICALKCKIF